MPRPRRDRRQMPSAQTPTQILFHVQRAGTHDRRSKKSRQPRPGIRLRACVCAGCRHIAAADACHCSTKRCKMGTFVERPFNIAEMCGASAHTTNALATPTGFRSPVRPMVHGIQQGGRRRALPPRSTPGWPHFPASHSRASANNGDRMVRLARALKQQ